MSLTSAPRSSVIHFVDERPGILLHQTLCGRRIGDNWAGEYTAEPAGPATCARCIARESSVQADLEASALHKVGERVGILTGVQSIGGPHVGSLGTVTAVRALWNGRPSFLVRADGESESYVFESFQLRSIHHGTLVPCDHLDRGHACGMPVRVMQVTDPARCEKHSASLRFAMEFPNGFRVRRLMPVSDDTAVIMAVREDSSGLHYVIASLGRGSSEWNAGQYVYDMVRADSLFRMRVRSLTR